jgi:hypothetical protein
MLLAGLNEAMHHQVVRRSFFHLLVFILGMILHFECRAATWETKRRNEAFKILGAIKSTNELSAAVGCCGVFMTLTNGAWIAIRVVVAYEPYREISLARDSEGMWSETKKKFSGRLTPFRDRHNSRPADEPLTTTFEATFLEKEIETAPTLEEARSALKDFLGFIPLPKNDVPKIEAKRTKKSR